MNKVYLTYIERKSEGSLPSAVHFYASLIPILTIDDNVSIKINNILETEETPRKILNKLEQLVVEQIREKPTMTDIFYNDIKDTDPKYNHCNRTYTYLANGEWPKRGETHEQARLRAKESNDKRNKKLLEIYQEFMKSISAQKI